MNYVGISHDVLREAASATGLPIAPIDDERIFLSRSGNLRYTSFRVDDCIAISSFLPFIGYRNQHDTTSCGFEDARRLRSMQPAVRNLTDIYIRHCAASNGALSETLRGRRVTRQERDRIERAIYRFETFRRVFGPFDGRDDRVISQLATSVSRTPGWLRNPVPVFVQEFKQSFDTVQLIQLHCIYGFLKRLVTPAVNDLLWHVGDTLGDERLVEYWATDDRVATQVLAGLQNVNDIWVAFKKRDMSGLVRLMLWKTDFPLLGTTDTALYQVLRAEFHAERAEDETPHAEVTRNKIRVHDTDSSPRDACLAVAPSICEMGRQTDAQLRREMDSLSPGRKWGFVFWDRQRLDMMSFFERPGGSKETKNLFLSDDLDATASKYRLHRIELRAFNHSPLLEPWWTGPFGQPMTLAWRCYNAFYPLAPSELDDAEDL